MTERVERLTELLMLLLDTPRPLTFDDIVTGSGLYPDRSESARKAFERDKASLRATGVEIRTEIEQGDRGATRYTIDPDDYFLPDLELTDDERVALQLGSAMVRLESSWDEAAILKLGPGAGDPVGAVVAEVPALDQLPVLHQAMQRRRKAAFGYRGRARVVVPRGLFYREGNWYLSALERGDEKVFRVDRIDGTVSLDEPYDDAEAAQAAGFDPAAAMPSDPLLIGDEAPLTARVEIDRVIAARVERQRGGVVERRPDGSVVVEVEVRNTDAFRSWVLGLRDHARVLEPPQMVEEIVSWLRSIAEVE